MLTVEDILKDIEKASVLPDPATASDDDIITEENWEEYIVEPLRNHFCFSGESWTARCGVTKGCIIFDNLPFVIKIPFMGESGYDYKSGSSLHTKEEFEDVPRSQRTSNCYYHEVYEVSFNMRFCDDEEWDYCAHEEFISDLAIEEGIDGFFAVEHLAGYVNNYPIYVQEKVEVYSRSERSSRKSSKEVYDWLNDILAEEDSYAAEELMDSEEWMAQALAYHGEDAFRSFIQFLETNNINDLHGANIGYIGDRPVLLDYSGFDH